MPGQEVSISELKADLFRALSNPGRIRILERLVEGERSVGDLQPEVGLELSHLSQQLGVLRRANLVTTRKEGALVFYSVKNPLLADVLATAKQLLISSLTETQTLLADLHSDANVVSGDGPDTSGPSDSAVSDEESRAAMRAFLQRSEVRLSTVHRVAQALLGGSALILLLPLFIRDGFPRMTTLLISSYDAHQQWVVIVGIAVAAVLSVVLPVVAIYLLVSDLLGFYFTSNTFGAPGAGPAKRSRTVFNPRFIIPGLGFNLDELSATTAPLLAEGRDDEWTKALLVPRDLDDSGWRDRFDTRVFEIWGTVIPEGAAGDGERLRQSFRLAGLNHDRTLAHDVARTEALLAKHVLMIRIVVLRYTKALLLLISTTVAILAASGLVEQAMNDDPTGGRFVAGFPYRYSFLVALVYVAWAPFAARSVTAPLRMIQRHTPGVGTYEDVYLDRRTTQFESATVATTLVVLIGAVSALMVAGFEAGGTTGGILGAILSVGGIALWLVALRGYRAGVRQTLAAVTLLARGREAPRSSDELRRIRGAPADA